MRALWLAWLFAWGPPAIGDSPARPRIANGVEANPCQWPSAVVIRDESSGTPFCSGTLIHPELVLLAAHCIDPGESEWVAGAIGFGESGWLPQFGVDIVACEMHPGYDPVDQSLDLAWCRLAEPAKDVPIVPLLMGCEVDALRPGDRVTIVGFGATEGIYDGGGGVDVSGQGPKRFTEMLVEDVDLEGNDLFLLGDDSGACFGDSGGPAFVSLPDGGWRVIGAASTVHPKTDYMVGDNVCTYGSVYELAFTQAGWLEGSTGLDVTPCHEADGTWAPGPGCRDFPLEPWLDDGSWSDGCRAGELSGWVSTCGPTYPEESGSGLDLAPPDDSGTGGLDDGGALVGRGCGCAADPDADPARGARWLSPMILVLCRRRRAAQSVHSGTTSPPVSSR